MQAGDVSLCLLEDDEMGDMSQCPSQDHHHHHHYRHQDVHDAYPSSVMTVPTPNVRRVLNFNSTSTPLSSPSPSNALPRRYGGESAVLMSEGLDEKSVFFEEFSLNGERAIGDITLIDDDDDDDCSHLDGTDL